MIDNYFNKTTPQINYELIYPPFTILQLIYFLKTNKYRKYPVPL